MTINVYGTGLYAVKFVLENQDIEVSAFIEGKKSKAAFNSELYMNVAPVVWFENAYSILKKNYTVIASTPNAYWEIKKRLEEEYNLVEFEDFCYFEIFNKKIAVIYGNCHMIPIKEALTLSKGFSNEYGFYPLLPVCDMKKHDGLGLNSTVFGRCDLFLHQCIWEKNIYGKEYASLSLLKKVKTQCKVIGLPNVYKMPRFLYPQMKTYDDSICWNGYIFFPFRDYYIDMNYKNLSVSELVDMIRDDKLIDKVDIISMKEEFYEKLYLREKEWDIKISNYIQDNLMNKQLFYDPNHPTNCLIEFIIKKIFELLRISYIDLNFDNIYKLDHYEMPIYEATSYALNLKYDIKCIRKYSKHTLNGNQMDLEEYVRQYIEWNHSGFYKGRDNNV